MRHAPIREVSGYVVCVFHFLYMFLFLLFSQICILCMCELNCVCGCFSYIILWNHSIHSTSNYYRGIICILYDQCLCIDNKNQNECHINSQIITDIEIKETTLRTWTDRREHILSLCDSVIASRRRRRSNLKFPHPENAFSHLPPITDHRSPIYDCLTIPLSLSLLLYSSRLSHPMHHNQNTHTQNYNIYVIIMYKWIGSHNTFISWEISAPGATNHHQPIDELRQRNRSYYTHTHTVQNRRNRNEWCIFLFFFYSHLLLLFCINAARAFL